MLSFTGNPLDRAAERRADSAWLAAGRAAGRFLPFWRTRPLLQDGRAAFLPWQRQWEGRICIFLGLEEGRPLFAVDLGADETAPPLEGEFLEMRPAALILPARDTAVAGQAKTLLDWHARHGFCPCCGHATDIQDAGWRRLCPACGAEHFPRTDPVVIMLPILGEECLLGRNTRFVNGLWSAFAGFVEPGETLEEAVRRELVEEVALRVGDVRYHASQPWPFPASLMLGCYARALSHDFIIDGSEIAEARWMTRAEARARLKDEISDPIRLPSAIAIAHHLIKDWAFD